MNSSVKSRTFKLFKKIILLDIFEEAIGEPFAQYISNNRSYGAEKEEVEEMTSNRSVEDNGQREKKFRARTSKSGLLQIGVRDR